MKIFGNDVALLYEQEFALSEQLLMDQVLLLMVGSQVVQNILDKYYLLLVVGQLAVCLPG